MMQKVGETAVSPLFCYKNQKQEKSSGDKQKGEFAARLFV